MASFKSASSPINASAEKVYEKFSNLDNLASLLKRVPDGTVPSEQQELLENIQIDSDSITMPGGPVGSLRLVIAERREPTLIRLEGEGTPVPLSVSMHIQPTGPDTCNAQAEIEIELPMMLAPMVKGPLQKMADQFDDVMKAISFD